jgi:hypothetical protein
VELDAYGDNPSISDLGDSVSNAGEETSKVKSGPSSKKGAKKSKSRLASARARSGGKSSKISRGGSGEPSSSGSKSGNSGANSNALLVPKDAEQVAWETEDDDRSSEDSSDEDEEVNPESATAILGSIVEKSASFAQDGPDHDSVAKSQLQNQQGLSVPGTNLGTTLGGSMESQLALDDPADVELYADLQKTLNFLTQQSQPTTEGTRSAQDEAFMKIRQEYDKLHKLFLQSRRNEQSLVKKCKDLTSELTSNAAKVQAALRLSQADRGSITALKKEVKKAWKMVEAAGEKETRAKEAIARLKIEVESLKKGEGDEGEGGEDLKGNIDGKATVFSGGYSKMIEAHMEQEQAITKLKAVSIKVFL